MVSILVFNEPVIQRMLNSPEGDVGQYLARRGRLIVFAAKKQVGVKTGQLRESIHMRHLYDSRGQFLMIGSEKHYALLHHEGSRPHTISPNRAQTLKFTRGAQVVYTKRVYHPGTKPNRYLTDHLRLVK
jgi:hypothetical protein